MSFDALVWKRNREMCLSGIRRAFSGGNRLSCEFSRIAESLMGRIYDDMSEGHSDYLPRTTLAIRPHGNAKLER